MQQSCEMSSIFEVDNVKNGAILRDFLNFQVGKIKNEAILRDFLPTASYQCVLPCFHSTCLKYCTCQEKVMPGLTKFCICHAKSPSQHWRSDAPKCNPSQEISALISYRIYLMCLLYYAYHAKCMFLDPLQVSHACHPFWNCHKTFMFCSLLTRCTIPCTCHANERPKALRTPQFLALLTSKCASHHNGVHFLNISNFQKWSEHGVFCTFWLGHVLRATTACTFLTSQLPKVVRPWCAFWLGNVLRTTTACNFSSLIWPAGSAPAALASLLFDPPEPQIIGKTQCFVTFLPFRTPGSPFFWNFLRVDLLSSSLLFSDSSHLCFSSVHMVGSLTSKFLSILRSSWVCFRTEAVTRHQGSACVDSGVGCKLAQYGSAQGLCEPLWEINGQNHDMKTPRFRHVHVTVTSAHLMFFCLPRWKGQKRRRRQRIASQLNGTETAVLPLSMMPSQQAHSDTMSGGNEVNESKMNRK